MQSAYEAALQRESNTDNGTDTNSFGPDDVLWFPRAKMLFNQEIWESMFAVPRSQEWLGKMGFGTKNPQNSEVTTILYKTRNGSNFFSAEKNFRAICHLERVFGEVLMNSTKAVEIEKMKKEKAELN